MELREREKEMSSSYHLLASQRDSSSPSHLISAVDERRRKDHPRVHNQSSQQTLHHISDVYNLHQPEVNQQQHTNKKGTFKHPNPISDLGPDPESDLDLESPQKIQLTQLPPPLPPLVTYKECQKNHAATTGGHVVDGCGEFMPSGQEGTPAALKCAACNCHRSFHRREADGELNSSTTSNCNYSFYNINLPKHKQHDNLLLAPPPTHNHHGVFSQTVPGRVAPNPIMMAFGGGMESSSEDVELLQHQSNYDGLGQTSSSKKRFRTKFNEEQKAKMFDFAEKLDWKIQKQDDEKINQFCEEVKVKRQVFKVWMHNNKLAMRKKEL